MSDERRAGRRLDTGQALPSIYSGLLDIDARHYDAWYDTDAGAAILATETTALRSLVEAFPEPRLEIGVGTGRFAAALGARFGLDPSLDLLRLARRRGILPVQGVGEAVPLTSGYFGTVVMAFTLCFLADPAAALAEDRRLLTDRGGLVIGFLPLGTPWADSYAARGRQGHPIYRHARFYTVAEVDHLLTQTGFRVLHHHSTLRQPPGLNHYDVETPSDRPVAEAAFWAVSAAKAAKAPSPHR